MKRMYRGLSLSLCAILLLAGCSCKKDTDNSVKANISEGETVLVSGLKEETKSYSLQDIYDDLKASAANEQAANRLIEIVADSVLSDEKWKARYDEKVEEKLLELAKDSAYQVDGEFSEELLVKTLRSKLYTIVYDEEKGYGPTYTTDENLIIDKYLLCDYTDYVNKEIRIGVLNELLKEKYVYDKVFVDKTNILTTKKARLVEYITIDSTDDEAFDFITDAVSKLSASESTVKLEDIKDLWEEKLLKDLDEEYAKIGTKDDTGSILQDFTNGYSYSPEVGLRLKKIDIYNGTYYDKLVITSDSNSILNSTLVERLLSDNVLTDTAKKTIKINDSYYLVSPLAGSNIEVSDVRITDTTNSKYYLIKVDIINSESSEDSIYDAVKVLATNSTLVSDSLNYYLEQEKNNISIHDEEIYAYLKTQYPTIFVD